MEAGSQEAVWFTIVSFPNTQVKLFWKRDKAKMKEAVLQALLRTQQYLRLINADKMIRLNAFVQVS